MTSELSQRHIGDIGDTEVTSELGKGNVLGSLLVQRRLHRLGDVLGLQHGHVPGGLGTGMGHVGTETGHSWGQGWEWDRDTHPVVQPLGDRPVPGIEQVEFWRW